MPILRNHSCGHVQRFCPRCLATGCGYSTCPSCIGENSAMVCKTCGCNGVISMENHQIALQARAREAKQQARTNEIRIKNLEKATKTVYVGGYHGTSYSRGGLFTIKNVIILITCYAMSQFLHYEDFTGITAIIVGVINILGAIVALAVKFGIQIIDSIW
jgi:hypothetical protein